MSLVDVEELAEGVPHIVTVEDREVGVILWRDDVFAVRNICPHQFAPICRGYTMPMIVSDDCGMVAVDDDRPVLLCPWHSWEFDVRTGDVVVGESNYRLKTYPAMIENGLVLVDLGMSTASEQ